MDIKDVRRVYVLERVSPEDGDGVPVLVSDQVEPCEAVVADYVERRVNGLHVVRAQEVVHDVKEWRDHTEHVVTAYGVTLDGEGVSVELTRFRITVVEFEASEAE
ncbi:MAG: hypothetical protein LC650_05775 [Actinobacteria bacterium]|nr:hypothetical protein [Actinomycetota bacterium]